LLILFRDIITIYHYIQAIVIDYSAPILGYMRKYQLSCWVLSVLNETDLKLNSVFYLFILFYTLAVTSAREALSVASIIRLAPAINVGNYLQINFTFSQCSFYALACYLSG